MKIESLGNASALLAAFALALVGCSSDKGGGGADSPAPGSAVIGADGGTVTSADGKLSGQILFQQAPAS